MSYHLNSFETKASLRHKLQDLKAYNQNLDYNLALVNGQVSLFRADISRLQTKLTEQATMLDELTGQVRTQANIVTSANLAKEQALQYYQQVQKRGIKLQQEVYDLEHDLKVAQIQLDAATAPRSLFDRIFGRD